MASLDAYGHYGANDLDKLAEAIMEGRRLDALDMLAATFPHQKFRSLRDQHRLFPDRVPAITEQDRQQ
jgi:hypothetical protein